MAKLSTNPESNRGFGPPRWADRLLKRLMPEDLREELLGDLHEQFAQQVAEVGKAQARRNYMLEVIRFCRPYFLNDARNNKCLLVNPLATILNLIS
jgi:hypothetical protein